MSFDSINKLSYNDLKIMIQFRFFILLIINIFVLLEGSHAEKLNLNLHFLQKIYIYAGPGTSPVAIKHTEYTLRKFDHPSYAIQKIDPAEVIQGSCVNNATLFVMRGEADIPYGESLNAKGNQEIQLPVQKKLIPIDQAPCLDGSPLRASSH